MFGPQRAPSGRSRPDFLTSVPQGAVAGAPHFSSPSSFATGVLACRLGTIRGSSKRKWLGRNDRASSGP
jgi:hypothetical protein